MPQMNTLSNYRTTISALDGWTCVTYHSTIIVKYNDAQIVLNSGGWHTQTTKRKMMQASNQFNLGFKVEQRDGNWFVHYQGKILSFVDGMILRR